MTYTYRSGELTATLEWPPIPTATLVVTDGHQVLKVEVRKLRTLVDLLTLISEDIRGGAGDVQE